MPIISSPVQIGSLLLRNRLVRSGCFEGMSQGGQVTDALVEHHRRLGQGGIGMTTVAYASVSYDGRAFEHELWMRPEIVPGLARLADAVHCEGAAVSIQIGHCGFFASPRVIGRRPLGASPQLCLFRLSYCTQMSQAEIDQKIEDFSKAAAFARQAGFDALEIHSGHGYLLSQFLSPWTNHRKDAYGGSLENRLRFPLAVLRRVREEVGPAFPILIKMNQRDGMPGGIEIDEAILIAQAYEAAGASALVPSCGFTAKTPLYMLRGNVPTIDMARAQESVFQSLGMMLFGKVMVQQVPFEPLFLLEGARKIKDAVCIPVGYVGGAVDRNDIERLIGEGFAFIQIGRATIRDPDFPNQLMQGLVDRSDCDHCNRCVAAMSVQGVYCVSRERGLLSS